MNQGLSIVASSTASARPARPTRPGARVASALVAVALLAPTLALAQTPPPAAEPPSPTLAPQAPAPGQQPPAPGAPATAARERLTLQQALERAVKVDPRAVSARGSQQVAAAAELSATGAYLPSLTASANSALVSSAGGGPDGRRPTVGAGLSLGYDLFTGFRRGAQRTQARAQVQSAEAGRVRDEATVALDTTRAFFAALEARELASVAEARVRRAQEGLEAARRKAQAGTGTRSDSLRAEVELNTAQQQLLDQQNQAEVAAFALGRLVGASTAVEAVADAPVDVLEPLPDAEAYLAEVEQGSPDVRAAEASAQSARAGVQGARSQYYPQLNLGAGYSWAGTVAPQLPGDTGWQVRLGLTFPLFDGFRREEAQVRAGVSETVAQAQLADTRRAVRSTAEQLLGALRLARQRVSLNEKSVVAATEDLRVQRERYRMGVSTMLELLTSQSALVEAETNLVTARYDYRVARAALLALVGRWQ